jgi:hypothetical protein
MGTTYQDGGTYVCICIDRSKFSIHFTYMYMCICVPGFTYVVVGTEINSLAVVNEGFDVIYVRVY